MQPVFDASKFAELTDLSESPSLLTISIKIPDPKTMKLAKVFLGSDLVKESMRRMAIDAINEEIEKFEF